MHIVLTNRTASELESLTVVKNEASEIGGRKINYLLLEIRLRSARVYAVAICENAYSELLTIHGGRENAEGLYETVKSGEVTPCELKDVAEDLGFCAEEQTRKLTLA